MTTLIYSRIAFISLGLLASFYLIFIGKYEMIALVAAAVGSALTLLQSAETQAKVDSLHDSVTQSNASNGNGNGNHP